MPDDPSQSPEPPRNDAPDPTDQLDVEAVLAEASGLSSKLGSEIGTADPSGDAGGGGADVNVQDVEARLGAVEELLCEVAGGESDDSAESSDESGTETGEPASETPQEDKQPEPPAASGEEHATTAVAGSAAGDEAPEQVPEAADGLVEAAPTEPSPESPPDVPTHRASWERWRTILGGAALRSRAMLETATRAVLDIFDGLDGVFSWINLGARRIIGWVALVIVTAACSITIYSISH